MNYGFVIDNRKCIGCHACTLACKSEHDVPVGVNRTHVKYIEKGRFPDSTRHFSVHRCNHCEQAPCVEICPTSALYTRADGIVDFDKDRCIGCKSCMQACPYDALYIDPQTHTAAKCNYCTHRVDLGLEPACVIVCPVEAIVSGDLDDPESKIAKLVAREPVTVRKPEKNTVPNLFYLEGDAFMLDPSASAKRRDYFSSDQASGVGHFASSRQPGIRDRRIVDTVAGTFSDQGKAKVGRVYDAPTKGVLWGWEVPGYIWTKAVATGTFLTAYGYRLLGGDLAPAVEARALLVSLAFLLLTAMLLVKDLDRPDRFLYVLLRPHWTSWLVRGAYIITGFGLLASVMLAALWLDLPRSWLAVPGMALAILAAVYTAFLLAQAKARDLWQSPLASLHMLVHALLAGAAAMGILEPSWVVPMKTLLLWGIALNLGLIALECLTPHGSADAKTAVERMTRGSYGRIFYGAVVLGNMLPFVLFLSLESRVGYIAACLSMSAGMYATEYLRVRVPQSIPLS